MIEPLRYNKETFPAYEIARPVFCHACLCQKNSRLDPNIAVKFCAKCPSSLGADKDYGAFLCATCDDKNHKAGGARSHVRRILVIGPGVRKRVVMRGDGKNFPLPLDHVSIKLSSKIYQNGRRVHRIREKEVSFISGMSGRCLHVQVLGARNLMVGDITGSSDPFIVYSFCGKPLGSTRIRPRSTNPRWDNETFIVPMDENLPAPRDMPFTQKDLVRLEVYDHDWVTSNEFLGHVEITRSKLMKIAAISNQLPIRLPLTMKEYHGFANLQFGFDENYLLVKVVRAENLNMMNTATLSNPYMKVFLGNSCLIGTTSVQTKTINPQWQSGNLFKIKMLQFLFAERYCLSQIDAYNETQERLARSHGDASRKYQSGSATQLMDEFANLPTNLALFRIEIYHDNKWRKPQLLGKAFVSAHKLRRMLPMLPSADIVNLEEYSKYVVSTVKADQASAKLIQEEAEAKSWLSFFQCCGKRRKYARPISPPSGAEFAGAVGKVPSPVPGGGGGGGGASPLMAATGRRRGNLLGAASSSSTAAAASAAPFGTGSVSPAGVSSKDQSYFSGTESLLAQQQQQIIIPYPPSVKRPPPPEITGLEKNASEGGEGEAEGGVSDSPLAVGLSSRRNRLSISVSQGTSFSDLSPMRPTPPPPESTPDDHVPVPTAPSADLNPATDEVEVGSGVALGSYLDDVDVDEEDGSHDQSSMRSESKSDRDDEKDSNFIPDHNNNNYNNNKSKHDSVSHGGSGSGLGPEESVESSQVPNDFNLAVAGGSLVQSLGIASIDSWDQPNAGAAQVTNPQDLDQSNDVVYERPLSTRPSPPPYPVMQSSSARDSSTSGQGYGSGTGTGTGGGADMSETVTSNARAPFLGQANSVNSSNTLVSRKSKRSMFSMSFRSAAPEVVWSESYPFPIMLDLGAHRGVDALGNPISQGFVVLRLIPATRGTVVLGLDEAVRQMTVGETAYVKCRFDYAYGSFSMGSSIPPRANVIFKVKLRHLNGNNSIFHLINRQFIRLFRSIVRFFTNLQRYLRGEQEMETMVKSKKAKPSASFSQKMLMRFGLSSRGPGKDSDSESSEGSESSEDDDEQGLLAGIGANAELDMGSEDGGSEDSSDLYGGRERVKPDPRMRKHLNQSVNSGAQIMWNFKPPAKVKKVKTATPSKTGKAPLYPSNKLSAVPEQLDSDEEKKNDSDNDEGRDSDGASDGMGLHGTGHFSGLVGVDFDDAIGLDGQRPHGEYEDGDGYGDFDGDDDRNESDDGED